MEIGSKIKILVVDDQLVMRMLVKSVLGVELFDYREAHNGAEGLVAARENPDIKLIVTDYHMPIMNGLELVSACKAEALLTDVPIIMLTSLRSTDHVESGRALGIQTWLNKPVKPEELRQIAHRLLKIPTALLVDDDESLRLALTDEFHFMGFEVVAAANPEEAIAVLYKHEIDLILSDFSMSGGLSGLDLLCFVQEHWPSIPFILMSGDPPITEAEARRLGAKALLLKPMLPTVLEEIARRLVGKDKV